VFIINFSHETLVIVGYLNCVIIVIIIVHDVIIDEDSFDEVTANVSADLIVSDISGNNNNTERVIITTEFEAEEVPVIGDSTKVGWWGECLL